MKMTMGLLRAAVAGCLVGLEEGRHYCRVGRLPWGGVEVMTMGLFAERPSVCRPLGGHMER